MDRLTYRNDAGVAFSQIGTTPEALLERLAEYEDIGLTPAEQRERIESAKRTRRKRYTDAIAWGVCCKCGASDDRTKSGKTRCKRCAEYAGRYTAKLSEKRREFAAAGVCTTCGGELDDPKYMTCAKCRERNRDAAARYRQRWGK